MAQDASKELKDLTVRLVQTYSNIVDLELDENLDPKLWYMPLISYEAKREASHYFLLAASLSDYKLTGNSRNIRMLLHHLHNRLGHKLYLSTNPEEVKNEIPKYESNKQRKSKSWLYLRWMVRKKHDLGLFQFDPKDLMVPLTTPKLRVYVALGLSNNEDLPFTLNAKNRPESWWKNTQEFDTDAENF